MERHRLAGHGDYGFGHRQWLADLDCARDLYYGAANGFEAGLPDRHWHVAYFDDSDGSSDECRRRGRHGRRQAHAERVTAHVDSRLLGTFAI